MTSKLVNKQLQYTYCPISQEVKAIKAVFGQLIEYNKRKFFFKNHAQNEAGKLVPDLFMLFKNAKYKVKASGLQLNFNII